MTRQLGAQQGVRTHFLQTCRTKTLKVLVDPTTQMILASQRWENIAKYLQKNSNLKIPKIGTICKSK
jgi:hypothetical protein